ncbi:Uma2 family endonuclease [Zavarzinia sp. CC-PAN008]|uniref:Uma2 family endonuclease n=1 Tax=Zavarzinia sp. CC-PAN008 TaxID=3243332 RepID=UPI003F744C4B
MTEHARKRMTLAEFLTWDEGTDLRYELIQGVPVAMAPALEAHDWLIVRLATALNAGIRPPCRAIPNRGVLSPRFANTFFLPDVVLTCEPLRSGSRYAEAPSLLAEVLSSSTQETDLFQKLSQYQDIPSVEDILFVWTTARRIDLWQRDGAQWQARAWIGDAVLSLRSAAPLSMADLYDGVLLETWDGGTRVRD